jgi:hypothetical protein
MKIPNKFEFTIGGQRTIYTYENEKVSWYDCGHKYDAPYTKHLVEGLIDRGDWTVTRDLDEKAPEEPELVFPFTYTARKESFKVIKDSEGATWWHDMNSSWVSTVPSLYSEEEIKSSIKKGDWIVTSVGEKVEGSHKPSDNATSIAESLKVRVDSSEIKAATEAMNAFAEAVENVNVSLESMQKLMFNMGLGNGGEIVRAEVGLFPTIFKDF